MAHYDALTDLPNRAAFVEHLKHTIDTAKKSGNSFALLSIDIDGFKEVNDMFGHAAGDDVLRKLSQQLRAVAGDAYLARLGGDEFTLITPNGDQPALAEILARRLQAAVAADQESNNQDLRVGISIGVAIFPTDGADATTLLNNADAALYRAKTAGRGKTRFFEVEMDNRLRERRTIQHELGSAIVRNEFRLFYQPQAKIDGTITGFEALVRWHNPQRGMVSPATFIPVAEESGLIVQIGEWVLREACREAASWSQPLQIAVNLSPIQFRNGDLAGLVHSVLLETGLAPARLELEITEGVLVRGFRARRRYPSPPEDAWRSHRNGRLRHRLFIAILFAVVPVRQDQDRPVVHIQGEEQSPVGSHCARRDRAGPWARSAGAGGGRRDQGAARFSRRRVLRRSAGLPARAAPSDHGIFRAHRP